ncbi:MAG: ATP-binding protein, partial [Planctomycetota bacterium]|nr:ATP-binding protein [Planctomycetota bacterium]
IHHVILNLVGNALEAAPEGGRILIRSRYHPDRDDVEVLVEDDGPGIPFDRRNRVFEPFYSTKGQRGTGLGLAVARKLVERHGGALEVDSSTGLGGALFRMTVPASRDEDLDASDTRGPNPIQGGDLGVRFEP